MVLRTSLQSSLKLRCLVPGREVLQVLLVLAYLPWSRGDKNITWIPTQGENALLAQLANVSVADLSSPSVVINARSTLGIIPSAQVGQWIQELEADPTLRTATVRWTAAGTKCSTSPSSCTKSLSVTVLEYSYGADDASDCEASALVSVDVNLPRHAVLVDGSNFFLPTGDPQYLVKAAPNSTVADCTYVVEYPPATQALANSACNELCFSSPCLQCADPEFGVSEASASTASACVAGPGLPAAVQAAVEGAAQCLAGGPISPTGRFQCNVAFDSNASSCGTMQCFPGGAIVQLEQGQIRRMKDLRIGDRVQAVSSNGQLIYSPIYMFGHQDEHVLGSFLQIRVAHVGPKSPPREPKKVLELSPLHFVPVGRGSSALLWGERQMLRAVDVAIGDVLWGGAQGADANGLVPFRVVSIKGSRQLGMYNPYTMEGTVVVDGLTASVHSDWLLDPLFNALGLTPCLPAAYQVLFAPMRGAYWLLGPKFMMVVDSYLDLGGWGRAPSPLVVSACAAASGIGGLVLVSRWIAAVSHRRF